MIKKNFKGGKKKAFNVSYDDGVEQDDRFIRLLNTYGIVGTFNINTGCTMDGFTWQHENGMTVRRLPQNKLKAIYDGHEIASHSLTHPFLTGMDRDSVVRELVMDKENLENWFDREISGFAYPFAEYNELTTECVKQAGFQYARIGNEPNDYSHSTDPYLWSPSIYHLDEGLMTFIERFIACHDELPLCQITGHTYDFDALNMWDDIELMLRMVSNEKDVWFASTHEIITYLGSMDTVDLAQDTIVNDTDEDLWFEVAGKNVLVQKNSTYRLEK